MVPQGADGRGHAESADRFGVAQARGEAVIGGRPVLRRLDEQDIVSPSRSDGGQRRYSRREVERLREVVALTEGGITLPGVREVLALRQRVSDLEEELDELRFRRNRDADRDADRDSRRD